ncbi:MAG: hypothetical protein IKU58_08520 [Clostridia bacterium]|nr:hypothetical protein [Clostridia bacterium]
MKILFWILAVLSIPVGLFVTVVSHMSRGLGLSGTVIGEIVCILGTLSIAVCIVGIVLGVLQLRKGKAKKAVVFVLAGILYSAAIMAGVYIDDALHTVRMNADIAERDTELYGENWNAPPNMEGIPEHYWEELNKCYAMVRDRWPSEETGNYGLLTMPGYYGEASLDNIGFLLKDLNGDGIEELAIGAVVPEENGGTAIFGIYGDPENVFMFPSAHEERIYYLHPGQTEGSYLLEIAGMGTPWVIMPATEADRSISVEDYQGAPLEPSQRMTLELIPFSQYK